MDRTRGMGHVANMKRTRNEPTPEPQFVTFQQFADHIKGASWEYIADLFFQESERLEYFQLLPWKKALRDPRSDYNHILGLFLLYVRGQYLPSLLEPKHARVKRTFEDIREDLNSRGQWPPKNRGQWPLKETS
jgi:hypothetical protein